MNRETSQMQIQVYIHAGAYVPCVAEVNEALHASFNLVEKWNIALSGSTSFPYSIDHHRTLLTLSNAASELKLLLLRGVPRMHSSALVIESFKLFFRPL